MQTLTVMLIADAKRRMDEAECRPYREAANGESNNEKSGRRKKCIVVGSRKFLRLSPLQQRERSNTRALKNYNGKLQLRACAWRNLKNVHFLFCDSTCLSTNSVQYGSLLLFRLNMWRIRTFRNISKSLKSRPNI